MADKTFTIEYDGLKLVVEATDNGDGTLSIKVLCVEGYANINAFYWSDGDDTGGEGDMTGFNTKKDSSLNMNGTDVDWDGGIKLSDSGLGKTPPPTYLQEGGSYSFDITASLDDLDTIGIRATSTSTAEGSIKGVAQEDEPVDTPDHFPDFTNNISHVDFYFDLDGDLTNGAEFIARVNTSDAVDDNVDNWYQDLVKHLLDENIIDEDADLMGAAIWGGNLFPNEDPNGKKYYYALDGDSNPDDPVAPGIVAKDIVDDDPDYGTGKFGFGQVDLGDTEHVVLTYDGTTFV